jgi:hypothetical protein
MIGASLMALFVECTIDSVRTNIEGILKLTTWDYVIRHPLALSWLLCRPSASSSVAFAWALTVSIENTLCVHIRMITSIITDSVEAKVVL